MRSGLNVRNIPPYLDSRLLPRPRRHIQKRVVPLAFVLISVRHPRVENRSVPLLAGKGVPLLNFSPVPLPVPLPPRALFSLLPAVSVSRCASTASDAVTGANFSTPATLVPITGVSIFPAAHPQSTCDVRPVLPASATLSPARSPLRRSCRSPCP